MAKATVTLRVMVTVDVPEEFADKVTREDLVSMAKAACPDSMTHPGGPNGTQVEVEGVAQEDEKGVPEWADLYVEHDITDEAEIEFEDDFAKAEDSEGEEDEGDGAVCEVLD